MAWTSRILTYAIALLLQHNASLEPGAGIPRPGYRRDRSHLFDTRSSGFFAMGHFSRLETQASARPEKTASMSPK